jgi:hypothetical protein
LNIDLNCFTVLVRIESDMYAFIESEKVIGYMTAPKQLLPVIIGRHGNGRRFQTGGGIPIGIIAAAVEAVL